MLERAPSQEVRRGSSTRGRRKPRARHVPIVQGSRRFVRARASEARLAGGCSRASDARSASGCSRASGQRLREERLARGHARRRHRGGARRPPFANSLADRRIANRRRTSRASKNRRQSGDLRVGSPRAHVEPRWRERACRISGKTPCGQALRSPPPPSTRWARASEIPAISTRLCFTQRANPAHTNLQTARASALFVIALPRVRAFRVQLRAATRERETNNQKNDQEGTIIQRELREKCSRCLACELGTAGK